MTITVSTDNPRSVKALAILATCATWTKAHRKSDGRSFFIIPSCSAGDAAYWTDQRECTCRDHATRGVICKHIIAVRLWLAAHAASPALATDAEINAFMSESAPAFRREEAARRRLITSSPFFQDAPAAVRVRPLMTYEALYGED